MIYSAIIYSVYFYKDYLYQKEKSINTIKKYIHDVRAFYSFLKAEFIINV